VTSFGFDLCEDFDLYFGNSYFYLISSSD